MSTEKMLRSALTYTNELCLGDSPASHPALLTGVSVCNIREADWPELLRNHLEITHVMFLVTTVLDTFLASKRGVIHLKRRIEIIFPLE